MDNRTIDEIRKNETVLIKTVLINELKQKEDIINKAKDFIESYYDFVDEKYDFKYFDGYKLLEILDNKGE